jgi:ribosome-binding protein aMBF1 (putative translation factor)
MKRPLKEFTKFEDYKREALKNPAVKKEYDLLEAEYNAIDRIIELRLKNKVSQKELARRIFTKQPSVSRLERGLTNPTVNFLSKVAYALGKKLVIDFK